MLSVNGVPYDTPVLGYRRNTRGQPAAMEGRSRSNRSSSNASIPAITGAVR